MLIGSAAIAPLLIGAIIVGPLSGDRPAKFCSIADEPLPAYWSEQSPMHAVYKQVLWNRGELNTRPDLSGLGSFVLRYDWRLNPAGDGSGDLELVQISRDSGSTNTYDMSYWGGGWRMNGYKCS